MYKKKVVINEKEVTVFKSKNTGELFYTIQDFFKLIGLETKSSYYKKQFLKEGLLQEFNDGKIFYLLNIKEIIKLTNKLKKMKNLEQVKTMLEKRKGLTTQAKKTMIKFLPEEIKKMFLKENLSSYFKKIEEFYYLERYSLLINNLYSFNKVDSYQIKNKIYKIAKLRKKNFSNTRGELICKTIECDLLKEKNKKEKASKTSIQKINSKLEVEILKLKKEIKVLEPEFHYWFDSKKLFSYNKVLKPISNNKFAITKEYKDWKKKLSDQVKANCYTRYLLEDKIFDFRKPDYIYLDIEIYMLETYAIAHNKFAADEDNYFKCFLDAVSTGLGINDKFFVLNSLKFKPVKLINQQGYRLGIRAK